MNSKIDAVNQALIFIGKDPITALDDGSPVAGKANLLIDSAIDETLRAHPWNFAIKRVVLDPLATAPSFGYTNQFQRPADWVRTMSLSTLDFRREGNSFLANEDQLQLKYIYRVTDLTQWDSLAAAALARNMAAKLAYGLTGSNTTQEAQWQMFAAILKQARFVDAQEEPGEEFEESSLLSVRR